ncbi:exocyst complex component 1-like [Lepisosteus oculatus]|uniref:Exocyst complex component 1 like n=1 Tax=Lepisosteus oculatus TaxID=7918 RepID=W5N9J0_LEPOC|nr:PREDICTED: exocyst complex component 1-like [Lepisosteus oculatus]
MSSLLKEEMQKRLFRPEGQRLDEFIEIVYSAQGRHFLCVSVTKGKDVLISLVKYVRSGLDDTYEKIQSWFLKDLVLLDGREADTDDPFFDMHFDKVHKLEALSCAAKYSFARCLTRLSGTYCQRELKIANFDITYIEPTSLSSNRGDCMVIMQICFYAFNLVCLSLCPVS